ERRGAVEALPQRPAFLRVGVVEDHGADVADVGVDGVAEHEQLEHGDEQGEEQRRRVTQDVQHLLAGDRAGTLQRKAVAHALASLPSACARDSATNTSSSDGSVTITCSSRRPRSAGARSASTSAWMEVPKMVAWRTPGRPRSRSMRAALSLPRISSQRVPG